MAQGDLREVGRGPTDSVLATLAALVVIGLLFALDPGGAIAESGFPDYREMDWTQLTAWGFRTIGVGVGLLLFLVLWLWPKYRPPQGPRRIGAHRTRQPRSPVHCRRQRYRRWKAIGY